LLDKDGFFGSAMVVVDATTKAITAATMLSSFMIAPRCTIGRLSRPVTILRFAKTRLSATAIYSRTKQQHKDVADAGQKLRKYIVAGVASTAKK
jgi:hypothetical protein